MSNKPWKQLMFMKEVRLVPDDPKNPMALSYVENNDYENEYWHDSSLRSPMLVSRDRRIQLEANVRVEIKYDYPETFKNLVAACGDVDEAYRIYKQLQKKVPDNWADYADEDVWN